MSAVGSKVLDHTVQLSHIWINELDDRSGWNNKPRSYACGRPSCTRQAGAAEASRETGRGTSRGPTTVPLPETVATSDRAALRFRPEKHAAIIGSDNVIPRPLRVKPTCDRLTRHPLP